MAGTGALQLGLELIVHNAMESFIGDIQGKLLSEPVLESHVACEARRGGEADLQLREPRCGQTLLAGWGARLFGGQEGREPPVAIGTQPEGNRVAMHGEMRCRVPSCGDLPRLEQDQQVQARAQVWITFTA